MPATSRPSHSTRLPSVPNHIQALPNQIQASPTGTPVSSGISRTPLDAAIDDIVSEPRISVALRLADALCSAAALDANPPVAGRRLAQLLDSGDDVTALAALHALGSVRTGLADQVLLQTIRAGEDPFAGHAAWNLAARRSDPEAVRLLRTLAGGGGFTAMLAERTLAEWSARGPVDGRATAAVEVPTRPHRPWLDAVSACDGIIVIQPHLHSHIDLHGSELGSGDAGGIASLLLSLGAALADAPGIGAVLTVTRRIGDADLTDSLTAGHLVERIDIGTDRRASWRELWPYRRRIEAEFVAIGQHFVGCRVVWHLRMADVGTLAAAAAARRLGQPVVFTAAPDPHVVLDALQDAGKLTRRNFATEDAAHQFWFRARMVERLSAQADRLVLLPKPTLHDELVELVGIEPSRLAEVATFVPEGVDLARLDAVRRRASTGVTPAVAAVLDSIPAHRRSLPWVLTVGRLHPTKGPHRVVEAVRSTSDSSGTSDLTGTSALTDSVNVVIVGGELTAPTADEQSTLELIRDASAGTEPGTVTLTGHLPPDVVADLAAHAARHGGIYVCASDKEEFGLAIVEALGAGLAVVAPRRGGPRSYIEHGVDGFLCDTLDRVSLGTAIAGARRLASDATRAEAARAKVRDRLGVGTMAARLVDVYEAATGGHQTRHVISQ